MPKKISKLTKKQEELMPVWRDRWIENGRRCNTTQKDKKRFTKAVKECYKTLDLAKPTVIWVDSPFAGSITASLMTKEFKTYDRNSYDGLSSSQKDRVRSFWRNYLGGCFWSGYPAWVSYFTEACDLDLGEEVNKKAEIYCTIAETVCWWWALESVVVACVRPTEVHLEDDQLHNESGPAIVWPDGWGFYMIDGVMVSEKTVLEPKKLTVKEIQEEENADAQSIMIDRFGITNYLESAKAKLIDSDTVPVYKGTDEPLIFRALFEGKDGKRWFLAHDGSTDRIYNIPAFDDVETCAEAYARVAGVDDEKCFAQG